MKFPNLSSLLSNVFDSGSKGFLKNFLAGAGLTLLSNGVFITLANQYIDKLVNQTGGLSPALASILHIAGVDYSISIVLSAIITRLAINPPSLSLGKKGT